MQLVVEVWREWMVTSLAHRFLINLKTCSSINSRKSRNRALLHMPVNMVMTLITMYYLIHLLMVGGPCCLQTLSHTEIVKNFSDLAFTSSCLLPSIVWTLASQLIYFLATTWGKYFTVIHKTSFVLQFALGQKFDRLSELSNYKAYSTIPQGLQSLMRHPNS